MSLTLFSHPFRKLVLLLAVLMVSSSTHSQTGPSAKNDRLHQLQVCIGKVTAAAPGSRARSAAAERVSEAAERVPPAMIDAATVEALGKLLDLPEQDVQAWVAGALGHFGHHAQAAVPRLLALLPRYACQHVDLGTGGAIEVALLRIGVAPPEEHCAGTR